MDGCSDDMKFITRMSDNRTTDEESTDYNLDPSDDYELNRFLADLADEITRTELKKLKYFIGGRGGSGKGTLERIEDPFDYFDHLRQKDLLSLDNLCLLQAFIWQLRRKDLYEKFVEFGRRVKRPLYFFAPKDTPENGYKHVRFHVVGKVDRTKVERIRDELARLLYVPREFIVVAGIEASGSLMITFMMPEECEMILLSLTGVEKAALLQVDVDQFILSGRTVFIQEDATPVEENEESLAMRELVLKERRLQKELDSCHSELILCKRKIKKLQEPSVSQEQNIAEMMKFISIMETTRMYYNQYLLGKIQNEEIVPALKLQSARKYFSDLLAKARRLEYDKKLIGELLQINEVLVKANISQAYQMQISQLRLDLSFINAKAMQLEYINRKLTFALGQDEEDSSQLLHSREFWQYVALQNALPVIQVTTTDSAKVDEAKVKEILYELSKELREEDKAKIRKSVQLNKFEEEKIRKDPNRVLETIMVHTRQPGVFDLGRFVYIYLKMANREDLKAKYNYLIEKNRKGRPSAQMASGVSTHTTPKGKVIASKKKKKSASQIPKQASSTEAKTMSDINSRLQKMETMIANALKGRNLPLPDKSPYLDDPETIKMFSKLFLSKKYGTNGHSSLYDVE